MSCCKNSCDKNSWRLEKWFVAGVMKCQWDIWRMDQQLEQRMEYYFYTQGTGTGQIPQWKKVFAFKTDDPSSIPRTDTPMIERETDSFKLSSDFYMCDVAYMHLHTH